MALPETLWLSSTTLGKVDDEHYRALVIDMVIPMPFPHLPTTTTMTPAAHFAPTYTVSTTTGALSFPSNSPSPTMPTSVPLLAASMPSMIRGSYRIHVPR